MNYAKAIVQFLGAVLSFILLGTVVGSPGDEALTVFEWCQVIVMALGVVPIAMIPNTVYQAWAKGIVAFFVAVFALVPAFLDGGIQAPELIQLILAGLTAAGVLAIGNKGDVGDRTGATGTSVTPTTARNGEV